MTCMIDRYHDLYHGEAPDIANCPYCQDDLMLDAESIEMFAGAGVFDRLEDKEM